MVLAVSLALTAAACGTGRAPAGVTASTGSGSSAAAGAGANSPAAQDNQVLATIKGPQGIVFTLTSARREAGGFVTVEGTVKNTGTELFTGTSYWRGDEADLQRGGDSLAGATLVDPQGKKRYYILRDTDGRCLCTTALSSIGAGQTIPIFMQFPAPPATTTQVDFQLPTLPTASITISG